MAVVASGGALVEKLEDRDASFLQLTNNRLLQEKKDQQVTHTHTDREQHPRHRHTHAHDENNTPNEHLPQALNNARRWRDDGEGLTRSKSECGAVRGGVIPLFCSLPTIVGSRRGERGRLRGNECGAGGGA